jgi:putative transposase
MSTMKKNYIARSRGVSRLYAHLVLTTKYRLDAMPEEILDRLKEIIVNLCEQWQCELIECNGEENHVHVLFRYAPQLTLSDFVNNLKSISSRRLRQEFEKQLKEVFWDWSKGFWSESYSVDSCGDAPLAVLRKYVQNQGNKSVGFAGIDRTPPTRSSSRRSIKD